MREKGLGGVGKHFLLQLSRLPTQPSLIFLSRSTKNLFSEDYRPIELSLCERLLADSAQPVLEPAELRDYLRHAPGRTILVDNTSSQKISNAYPTFLASGVSIVTPNKKAFSSGLPLWQDIMSTVDLSLNKTMIYHESSVGAGLPVISTLKDLLATGDQIVKIEGVFSGTMSFLFNKFAPASGHSGAKWSQVVSEAKEAGYTEPDPRDDLNGMDVARKLTILARMTGLDIESPTCFPVQSLIPRDLESEETAEGFMKRLPEFDMQMEEHKEEATRDNKIIRYVGSIHTESREVNVGLQMVDRSSPMGSLKGSDNLICFYTDRYGPNPLVIQGAGAGGAVTAMGVTADLIKVMERLT